MASLWPRHGRVDEEESGFEREGDKLYLAPEILQGTYGKAADVFRYVGRPREKKQFLTCHYFCSFGMTMLETAANIVVPAQ